MFNKVLVVCVGNICRSPTGERLLQRHLPNKHIASAGIGTEKSGLIGKPAERNASQLANQYGLSLDGHQAQQLTRQLCKEYDLILVMEKGHIEAVCQIAPEVRGKTLLFGQWIGQKEIPDPYQKSPEVFKHVFDLIEASSQSWAKKLQ
ncbi:low molecular weight phosphotyrosine protein phosphatase [Vibrio sp.]|uniref:arsenate reductase/protein-tyrosine-phosphatase family protein n=1 Tax=Vibrio sp. TaxID=678 RepID=UPI003AA8CE51